MLKEIYFRDPTDPKYRPNKIEDTNEKEALLSKIRMILFTARGEVLGEPELGMDLDEFIFDKNVPVELLKRRFYTQLAKYVPERKFKIDMDINVTSNGIQNSMNIFIKVDDAVTMGVHVS